MGFQDKILQQRREQYSSSNRPVAANENTEEALDTKFFGIENNHAFLSCLDLRLTEGRAVAIPYSFIAEIYFDASDGIEILTASKKITITGRNLRLLYTFLTAYRVKYIQSNVGNDMEGEIELFVKDIIIGELD